MFTAEAPPPEWTTTLMASITGGIGLLCWWIAYRRGITKPRQQKLHELHAIRELTREEQQKSYHVVSAPALPPPKHTVWAPPFTQVPWTPNYPLCQNCHLRITTASNFCPRCGTRVQ